MAFMDLEVDCWETIFDYTPLKDIHSLAQTCKRMQAIAGYYFRTNSPNAIVKLCSQSQNISVDGIEINGFREHMENISIHSSNIEDARYIGTNNFNSLRSINFNYVAFSSARCQVMRPILSQIECLTLYECVPSSDDVDLYVNILKWCANLRTLKIGRMYGYFSFFGPDNRWLLEKYPTLEHIDINMFLLNPIIVELSTFLEQNPNVKKMSIMDVLIQANWHSLMESECKLETLVVGESSLVSFEALLSNLNALHDRGFYQRLGIGKVGSNANLNNLHLFRGLVEFSSGSSVNVNIPHPIHLEMMKLNIYARQDFEAFIETNLVRHRVEKLKVKVVEFSGDHLLFVIRHLPTLVEINYQNCLEKFINLPALNEERQKIPGAHRVIIGVREDVYLATMWRFGDQNFSFVTIKRSSYHHDIIQWYQDDLRF